MLGVGGVGLFCGRGHLQTREIKRSQEESREIKRKSRGNQEESRGVKGIKRSQGDQCEPRKNEMK